MRYYLPGIGRFISRVHLHQAVAAGRTTYRELHDVSGINIGPLGTPAAFARNRVVSEHPYSCSESNPLNVVDPSGLWCLHLPGHNCIGRTCHGDPYCKPAKPTPTPKPHKPPTPSPQPAPTPKCCPQDKEAIKKLAVAQGKRLMAEILKATTDVDVGQLMFRIRMLERTANLSSATREAIEKCLSALQEYKSDPNPEIAWLACYDCCQSIMGAACGGSVWARKGCELGCGRE